MRFWFIIVSFWLTVVGSLFVVDFSVAQVQGKGSLSGYVFNNETQEKIIGANVSIDGTVLGTTTNAEGKFVLRNLPAQKYILSVSMIGYKRKIVREVSVLENDDVSFDIYLEPTPVQTQPVIVTASKREQSIQEIPVALSVVDEKLLTQRNSVAVDDALRYV
ncbi:MAG: carboxypeptidase-like regulatory domain-containing protein, partial [Ignavibacteriae bacterium]|nr:carboxypeptidase-like regulatory domain-containing protein [Ignavibacteriota bacterium]